MPALVKDPNRWPVWTLRLLLVAVCLALYVSNLNGYPLFDVDEPRYAESAREMIVRGDWITPYFNDAVRFDKPVLFYWLIMLSYGIFGVSEFAARLVSAFAAMSMVLGTFEFGRFWVSKRFGLIAALILATCVQMIGLARMSITDMTLASFMVGTSLTLFMACHRSQRWWLLAGLLSGLGVLTKGPVAIVLPGMILMAYATFAGRLKHTFATRWFPVALALCFTVSIPWYLLAWQANGQPFLDALFLHNVDRFKGVVSGHDQPWYFFLVVILAGFLPWSLYFPAQLRWLTRQSAAIKALFRKTPELTPGEEEQSLLPVTLYSLLWAVLVFLFFTAAQTKLLTYILPLFPAASLAMATLWYREPADRRNPWLLAPTAALAGFATITVASAVLTWAGILPILRIIPPEARHLALNPANAAPLLALAAGGLTSYLLLKSRDAFAGLLSLASTMLLSGVLAFFTLIPAVNHVIMDPFLGFLEKAGRAPLATYDIIRPSLTFYARRKIEYLAADQPQALPALMKKNRRLYVITKRRLVDPFGRLASRNRLQWVVVDESPVYSLIFVEKPQPIQPK
jgi:4-amino-4-deoxy-L-arabinose transferase-like glycosyltransferase